MSAFIKAFHAHAHTHTISLCLSHSVIYIYSYTYTHTSINRNIRFSSQPKCASASQSNCFFNFTYFTLDKFDKKSFECITDTRWYAQYCIGDGVRTVGRLTVCSVQVCFLVEYNFNCISLRNMC